MKPRTNHWNVGRALRKFATSTSILTETAALILLSVIGLLLIIALLPRSAPGLSSQARDGSGACGYIHSRQFMADLRTAAAAIDYLLEPIPPEPPRPIGVTPVATTSGGRTNTVRVGVRLSGLPAVSWI